MTLLQAFILGVVQGITEFLPISSSAHLVFVPWMFGWNFDAQMAFVFDVLVQLGTLVAVILYFWQDLIALLRAVLGSLRQRRLAATPEARLAWFVLLSSLPAAILGLGIKPWVERAFDSPVAVSAFLLLTAAMLFLGERLGKRTRPLENISLMDALLIGFAQVFALFPGVSRSGSTISAGLLRDVRRTDAARFSFLMALPVMVGAGAIALLDLAQLTDWTSHLAPLLVGFLSAAVVGYLAIRWLLAYLKQKTLTVFVIYCLVAGAVGLLVGLSHG